MTEKLKTVNELKQRALKDSKEWYENKQRGRYERKGIKLFNKRLKAEAIKKIKYIRENHKLPTGEVLNPSKELYVRRYIMWDNNLTEEDLK